MQWTDTTVVSFLAFNIGPKFLRRLLSISVNKIGDVVIKSFMTLISTFFLNLVVPQPVFRETGVIGMRVSPGIVFPAHISLGMRVSPHIYH